MTNLGHCFLDLAVLSTHEVAFKATPPTTYKIGDAVYVVDHYWPAWITNMEGSVVTVMTISVFGISSYDPFDLSLVADREQLRLCPSDLAYARTYSAYVL